MKVLFECPMPFSLAHGGAQVQLDETMRGLMKLGVDVEPLRWWDADQRGDIIHYLGRPAASYIQFAQAKGMKIVLAELVTGTTSRSTFARFLQKAFMRLAERFIPTGFLARMGWDAYRMADAVIAITSFEAQVMEDLFRAPRERIHVIPNGVEEIFFESAPVPRDKWLVCTATIAKRKRVLELAQAAVEANVPIWIIGGPYDKEDAYYQAFLRLQAQHPDMIRYEGPIADRPRLAGIYREARGFALLSTMENLSISALEAVACECPLLLSDLPWARTGFGEKAIYCSVQGSTTQTAAVLRSFYDSAPDLPIPPKPLTWSEVAGLVKALYESLPASTS